LRQSITLYKNLGGLEPLSPIASAATASNTALGPAVQCQYRNAMVALVHCLLTILGISLLAPSYQNYLKWLFSIDSPHIFLAQTINVDLKNTSVVGMLFNCVRNVIEKYISNGSTINVCALDLSKAFDRMNHYA